MIRSTILLASSAAIAILATANVSANSGNTLYISQDGDSNSAIVQQGAGTGSNDFGVEDEPVEQIGNSNSIRETQSTGAGFSRGNNDVIALVQQGNNNKYDSDYSNSAGGNRIEDAGQIGNGNTMHVRRNGSVDSVIGTVLQQGNANFFSITQTGTGQSVGVVQMIGSNNGWSIQPPGGNGSRFGTVISQGGTNNRIDETSIHGSSNNASGVLPGHRIRQVGIGNGQASSTAVTYGTASNVDVLQTGNDNNFEVLQGTAATPGTGNVALLTQTGNGGDGVIHQFGDYNDASITQAGNDNDTSVVQTGDSNDVIVAKTGDGNVLDITQTGDDNTISVTLDGDGNNAVGSSFAAFFGSAGGLAPGDIVQSGNTNTATLTSGLFADNNLFAFKQDGNGNTVTGDIDGDGNQALVIQVGNTNIASFTQTGGSNFVSITQ